MVNITLELSPTSCYHARQKLEAYGRRIDKKLDQVCKRLAEIGAGEASAIAYAAASQNYGNNDVSVSKPIKIENGYKVEMSGEDIFFVEFGTGIFAGEYAGDASNVTVGIMPASYSETHAKQFSEKGYWFYGNQFLRGTPAYMPMYYAIKKMREEMPRIAQEIFGK